MGLSLITNILTYIFGLIVSGINLVITLFHSLYIVDLESDSMHPIDFVKKANRLMIPEIIAQVVLFVTFIPHTRWLELMVFLPMTVFLIYQYFIKKHRYHATTVYDSTQKSQKINYVRLGYYVFCIFLLLARLLYFLITHFARRNRIRL